MSRPLNQQDFKDGARYAAQERNLGFTPQESDEVAQLVQNAISDPSLGKGQSL